MTTFSQLGLPHALVRALSELGITTPFPVQSVTIPDALAGRDVSAKAPTGSGKTLAFGLPLLVGIEGVRPRRPRGLVLSPTRELAEQIKTDLVPLARAVNHEVLAVYGGTPYRSQQRALDRGAGVVVATPGRLEDLIRQRALRLDEVQIVVVDEADRMADMGFLPAVRRILDLTPSKRQTHLFSATLDRDVATLSKRYQRSPVRHDASSAETQAPEAQHCFWLVEHHDRVGHTADVLSMMDRSIVFTRTRRGADRLTKQLVKLGIEAVPLHGGRSQRQRTKAVRQFSNGQATALVATDVAARGIHIDAVESVVHFDPPADAKDYLHRSGRTARAGAGGSVLSLVTPDQKRAVGRLQKALGLQQPLLAPDPGALLEPEFTKPSLESGKQRVQTPALRSRNGRSHKTTSKHNRTTKSLYVANLAWKATAHDMRKLFSPHGPVHQTTLITDNRTGRSKGYGFVDMPEDAARSAIRALHGTRFQGRDLTVRFAKPRRYGR